MRVNLRTLLSIVSVIGIIIFFSQGPWIQHEYLWTTQNLQSRRTYVNDTSNVAGDLDSNVSLTCQGATVASLRVAFLGDTGLGKDTKSVYALLRNMHAMAMVHAGDMDYVDDALRWDKSISKELGVDFPVIATMGNADSRHGIEWWSKNYGFLLQKRLARISSSSMNCDAHTSALGEGSATLGLKSLCTLGNGLVAIISVAAHSAEAMHDYDDEYYEFLRKALRIAESKYTWRVCSWHKPAYSMNVGNRKEGVPERFYDLCRQHGAIIHAAHEHYYVRTHLMASFSPPIRVNRFGKSQSSLSINSNASIAFCSGLGGKSFAFVEADRIQAPWWAVVYPSDNIKRDSAQSRFTKQVVGILSGTVVDEFSLLPPPCRRSEESERE